MYTYIMETITLKKSKIMNLPHAEKVALIKQIYDLVEEIEDMDFIQQDKKQEDAVVQRTEFKTLLTQ